MTAWHEEALGRQHDRAAFDCGNADLNQYLRRFARQNQERGGARTFVLVPDDRPGSVIGYYSLTVGQINPDDAPPEATPNLGGYPLPVFRLARLAVALEHQRRGVGKTLLALAGHRSLQVATQIGGVGLVVDAIDSSAADWYRHLGAYTLLDNPRHLMFSMEQLAGARRTASGNS